MSSIIIDGYNLIGICHKNLEAERQKLIKTLSGYKKIKGHDITVVFDGWKSGCEENTSLIGGIRVIYSGLGEKADSVIKRTISSKKIPWIVITSDRDISNYAWSKNSIVISSDEFRDVLDKQDETPTGKFELIEDDGVEPKKKGSPRMLSKREKAKKRALSKL